MSYYKDANEISDAWLDRDGLHLSGAHLATSNLSAEDVMRLIDEVNQIWVSRPVAGRINWIEWSNLAY